MEKAAAHYGGHPAIVGWQIDNELNCETCEFYAEAIENRIGKGRVIHFGSAFSRNNVRVLFEYAGIKSPFQEYIEAPDTVEVVLRRKEGREFLFVLNFQAEEVSYVLKGQTRMLYTGETASGECRLGAFGTAVYEV